MGAARPAARGAGDYVAALLALWRGRDAQPREDLTAAELPRVLGEVRALTRGLGAGRGFVGRDYMADALGAYLLHLWPVSYAQAAAVLAELAARAPDARLGRALDLGSGPGGCAMALLDAGATEVVAADRSPAALAAAAALATARGGALATARWEVGAPLPAGRFDTIFMGHLLNEIGKGERDPLAPRVALLEAAAAALAPGGRIAVLDPATHAINAGHLALRDRLHAAGWVLDAPCAFDGPCPARAAAAACHASLDWRMPALTRRITQAATIDKAEVGYSFLIVRPPGSPPLVRPSGFVRLVSERMLNKARRERFVVCAAEGRRALSAAAGGGEPWRATWRGLGRGDAVVIQGAEGRESGWGLTQGSRLRRT